MFTYELVSGNVIKSSFGYFTKVYGSEQLEGYFTERKLETSVKCVEVIKSNEERLVHSIGTIIVFTTEDDKSFEMLTCCYGTFISEIQ